MPEALFRNEGDTVDIVSAAAAYSAGQVIQHLDGRAGVVPTTIASGSPGSLIVKGIVTLAKAASVVLLRGQEVWWDHSANNVTYWATSDLDFRVGVVQKDAASADTTVQVALNERARCIFDAANDPGRTVLVMTTVGSPQLNRSGGSTIAKFGLAAEAQKIDLISVRSWLPSAPWILQAVVAIVTDADADVGDLNVGVANATHASDADAITESCFFHQDMGADANIDAESDDGTTEVAATDTTIDRVVGTPLHLLMDGRDHTDIQLYINGVNVLPGTTFTLAAATGPLKALFHLEKSSNDSPGEVALDDFRVWLSEQNS